MPRIFNLQRLILASAAFAIFAIMVVAVINSVTFQGLNSTTFTNINQWRLGHFGPANNVPEPASLFLLGSGLAGTAGVLRRRLRNRQNQ